MQPEPTVIELQDFGIKTELIQLTPSAYHRSENLGEQLTMMQWEADYLDGLKCGAVIIPMQGRV